VQETARYRCRFARDERDLNAVLRLRYEVFNLELGEGLAESEALGLDRDRFDAHCHHIVLETIDGARVVGTYRLATAAMAEAGCGFYSAGEFDFAALPESVRSSAVELGRACVAVEHRSAPALALLWRAVAQYAVCTGQRHVFGCCSLTTQDPAEGGRVGRLLRARGQVHPDYFVAALPGYECVFCDEELVGWENSHIPRLFRTYLRYGAMICGEPALDRDFQTIDFLAMVDLERVDPIAIVRQFDRDMRRSP
jgi:putative hemolysin